MADLDRLTNEGAVSALRRSAAIYARRHALDVRTLHRMVAAITASEAAPDSLPSWLSGQGTPDWEVAGPLARRALQAMLDSPPAEGLHAAAADAVADELAGRAQAIDPLTLGIGGAVLIALGLLSKWSYSPEHGHRFESGFPDLDKVLEKLGAIFRKLD